MKSPLENEQDAFPQSFLTYSQELFETLQEQHDLDFGPTYLTTTSRGEILRVLSYRYDYGLHGVFKGERIYYYVLLALNADGLLTGLKDLTLSPGDSFRMATGYIETSNPGQGVAIPLELAYLDTLQREAYRLDQPVKWKLIDRCDKHDRERRARWEALYAPGGILGIRQDSTRIIHPTPPVHLWDAIDTCHLERLKPEQVAEARENVRQKLRESLEVDADDFELIDYPPEGADGGDGELFWSYPQLVQDQQATQSLKKAELLAAFAMMNY